MKRISLLLCPIVALLLAVGCDSQKKVDDETKAAAADSSASTKTSSDDSSALVVPATSAKEIIVESGPVIGQMAPTLQANDTDGRLFSLADYRGKVVLLDFWGNW